MREYERRTSSWPGLSGPPVAARSGIGSPDKPAHDTGTMSAPSALMPAARTNSTPATTSAPPLTRSACPRRHNPRATPRSSPDRKGSSPSASRSPSRPLSEVSPAHVQPLHPRPRCDRWKCATGSSARLRFRLDQQVAGAQPDQHRLRRLPLVRIAPPGSPADNRRPAPRTRCPPDRRATRLTASSSLSSAAASAASSGSSQRRNPGIGDSVANVFRLRNSPDNSSTTRLIRKLPKLIPASPAGSC